MKTRETNLVKLVNSLLQIMFLYISVLTVVYESNISGFGKIFFKLLRIK
ncbi:MAG: hypothetical protein ACFWT2_11270 [Thermoanaerobacterium thermosaccharolyticum]